MAVGKNFGYAEGTVPHQTTKVPGALLQPSAFNPVFNERLPKLHEIRLFWSYILMSAVSAT
jgi:hypothetical protein